VGRRLVRNRRESADRVMVARPVVRDAEPKSPVCVDGNAPEPRYVHEGDGAVYAIPHLGGLHHENRRAG
jgi:hypothetical protein